MSDPLSVAGSAVGIISLGIQVCQGLISSLQSFKGQDQDIQDSLNDVQTVISILYSLKGILPKVDERSSGTPAIRRCLAESEEKLREFQQFSLKLRGTQSTEHGIHTNVEDLGNAFKDQGTNVAKLSDQLQRLDNSMSAYYQDLKSEISRTQLFAQDFRQEVGGQLRLISTDVGSLMSINRRHQEDINQGFMKAFDELKEQNNFQKELIRTALVSHVAKISNDNANRIPLKGMDGMSIQNTGSRQATSLARARVSKQHYIEPSGCTCERQREYSTLSYRFWHATFEDRESSPYDQDERGRSHALLALERTLFAINRTLSNYLAQSTLESLSLSAKRLIETLVSTVGDENGEMRSIFLRMILKNELRGLARFCLTTFNLDLPTIVLFVCREAAYRPKDLWPSLHGSEHIFELHPIMRAIFQESSSMLEIALSKSPEAVRERIGDVTTVELCSYWPEGLQKLLRTEAVDVLNEFALQIAVQADCIESADLLLKAGCPVDYGYTTDTIFNTASEQCMDVIASNLARRRSDLLSLAEQHQAICQGLFTVIDRPDISAKKFSVLMNCKPERWQKIRSDQREQENAALLKTLMEEFIAYMIGMESSARCLEMFVNGYWRQRISEIFAVDADEIKDINNCLVGTKTYVLPDRARVLLGRDFKLIELHDLKSELTRVGETAHDEKVELGDEFFELFPC
ncbi:hypothetical protein FPCIR_3497 [Fusarium pseudocircinatum]|uniref:Fungal N-terminal domain-containing protein n=1 Tax=Fusarium pseudocircinatum TaxID=56676 RepID=A0A8H5PKF2_9HYPO|nr:hypothetical protein FPCIR_3497 [Fusarium pseudocircinatum]